MRLFAAILLAGLLLAPVASAQTRANPVQGAYTDIYLISGRAVDADGDPVAGGELTITLEQPGVTAEPLRAVANCKGDFITYFTLRHVEPTGKARIRLAGPDGAEGAETTVGFDPFFRRSDATLRLPGDWGSRCTGAQDVWDVSLSVAARILNRTDEYLLGSEAYHAKPYTGIIRLRYETPDGQVMCPPLPNGPPDACETFVADERGDFRYTFTLDSPIEAGGKMSILLDEGTHNATVDPVTRIAVMHVEASGRGPPAPVVESPGAPLGAILAGALAAALVARRVRPNGK